MSITITPSDATKLENLTAETLWREVHIPFVKKYIPAGNLNRPIGRTCLKMLRGLAKKDKIKESLITRGSCPALRGKLKGDKKDADRSAKQPRERVREAQETREKQKKTDLEGLLLNILANNKQARSQQVAQQTQAVDNILLGDKNPSRPQQFFTAPPVPQGETLQEALFYSGQARPTRQQIFRNQNLKQATREGRARYRAFQEGHLAEFDEFIANTRANNPEEAENIKRWLGGVEPQQFEYDSEEEMVLQPPPRHDEYFPWSERTPSIPSEFQEEYPEGRNQPYMFQDTSSEGGSLVDNRPTNIIHQTYDNRALIQAHLERQMDAQAGYSGFGVPPPPPAETYVFW